MASLKKEGFLTDEQREVLKIAAQNVEVLSSSPRSPGSLLLSEHQNKGGAGGKSPTGGKKGQWKISFYSPDPGRRRWPADQDRGLHGLSLARPRLWRPTGGQSVQHGRRRRRPFPAGPWRRDGRVLRQRAVDLVREPRVEELKHMDLAEVAEVVHRWLRAATTEEHFRGLVDWVEAQRPEPAVAKIYLGEEGGGVGCVVSSGRSFPVGDVQFGWGRAVFGSYHFPWDGSSGYVMPMPSASGNGDWVVYVHLLRRFLDVVEAGEPPVFRPLTAGYFLANAK